MVHEGVLVAAATQVIWVVGVGTSPPRLWLLQGRCCTSMWVAAGPITAVDHQMEGTTEVEMETGVDWGEEALQIFVQYMVT